MNVCTIPAITMDNYRASVEERVYVQPVSLYVTHNPTLINTVLGSSVSVCLWSPSVAGMNHFILPRGGSEVSPRYGKHALQMLLDGMHRLGAVTDDIIAAIFGGASLLGQSGPEGTLGQRNVNEAHDFLARYDIPLVRYDVGGHEGRKLTFRTLDGSTIVRKL